MITKANLRVFNILLPTFIEREEETKKRSHRNLKLSAIKKG